MENILQGIPHVAVYLDDIILTGATKAQHVETLDMVLGRLEEAGFRLKRKKYTFLAVEVVYLRHRIDQHGLHPVQDKVEAILKARPPENVQELQAFSGLLNYYKIFLLNLISAIAQITVQGTEVSVGTATSVESPKSEGTPSVSGSVGAL